MDMPHPDEVKARLKAEAAVVEGWLACCLDNGRIPEGLKASMRYSLLAGGKRIRPVLCLLSARMCGLGTAAVLPFAGALECIHTYSLVHDDLPAMDDDDLRRGKPSNHKQFDEATAILAGDALLTDAFAMMAAAAEPTLMESLMPWAENRADAGEDSPCAAGSVPAERVLQAMMLVARAAGSGGMVGGQFLDMQYTARQGVTLEELAGMHAMKTGAMLRVSCEAGAVLAGAGGRAGDALSMYGKAIGLAFQITDDILDETGDEASLGKPVGSDAEQHKSTYPSLVGLARSKELAAAESERALAALDSFEGPDAALLRGLAAYIVNRVS